MRIKINKGDRFGRLTFIKDADSVRLPSGQINRMVYCECDCGNKKNIRLLHLVRHRILSCGCIKNTRGGMGNTSLCKVWRQMKDRCSKNYFENKYYYKMGIRVCDEWKNSWESFYKWAINNGYKKGLQIDRIDGNKNYCPENCRWVTAKVNNNNKINTVFVEYSGEKIALKLLLEKLGKQDVCNTVYRRFKRGWDIYAAIDTPIRKGNYRRKFTQKPNQ